MVILGVVTDEWVGLVGIAATVIGFGFAFRAIALAKEQVGKTLSAAEATREAVTTTEAQLARNELMTLVADLQRIDREIASAIITEKPADAVAEHLADWRDNAFAFAGLLEERPYGNTDLIDALTDSAKKAAQLLVDLPDAAESRKAATAEVRGEISSVCGQVLVLRSKLKLKTREEPRGTTG